MHEVMGTLKPVDSYVADLITAYRKAFEVAQNMTQTWVLRQKRRYDQKSLDSDTEQRGCSTHEK